MLSINNLPSDIYLELQSWLEYEDQIAFAMANRTISGQLIKRVRRLSLQVKWKEKENFEQKFRSYLTSEKHQSLITDPYHQLELFVPDDLDLKAAGFEDIRCKTLSFHQLTTSLIQCVKKVQHLMVGFNYGSNRYSITDSELQFIADLINHSDIGLKQLSINSYDITHLPVISSLESLKIASTNITSLAGLNISAYSNLRCLKLRSNSVEDVSSLDSIHELYLTYCDEIQDISCLNHNYKIVIEECYGITDYSNCFRSSKIINITCPSKYLLEPIKRCDLSKAVEAREIYFSAGTCTKPLLLPQSSSLRYVEAEFIRSHFTLPSEHEIREIIVRYCTNPRLTSLLNFNGIYSVKLFDLNISTLQGLGSSNRVVEVDCCPLIKDFRMLRHCDKVTIRNCKGFQDVNQIRGVKEFIFSPVCDVDKLPNGMEGVTCLILDFALENLLSLQFPSTLKKLVFGSANSNLIQQFPFFLASLPHHVAKVEISVDEALLEDCGVLSFPEFIIEFKKGIHFLRKIH